MNYQQASLDDIMAWANDQPWCRAMADCQQDAEWHSEGDVWTHTKMVCPQLCSLTNGRRLLPHEQTVLLFTALFHDCGKPLTSQVDPETGRITSPKHGSKGEHLARAVLRDLDCDLSTREEIARLVRYHGRPPFLLDKADPTHEVVSLSWLVSNKLLYLLALADTRGRTTERHGAARRESALLEDWLPRRTTALTSPTAFANDHARFLFYRQREPEPVLHSPRRLPLHGDGDVGTARQRQGHVAGEKPLGTCRWFRWTTFGGNWN